MPVCESQVLAHVGAGSWLQLSDTFFALASLEGSDEVRPAVAIGTPCWGAARGGTVGLLSGVRPAPAREAPFWAVWGGAFLVYVALADRFWAASHRPPIHRHIPSPPSRRPPQALNCLVSSFPAVAAVAAEALGEEVAQEELSPAIVKLLRTQLVGGSCSVQR
jgi:hypothetical protein